MPYQSSKQRQSLVSDPNIPHELNIERSKALHAYYKYCIEKATYLEIIKKIVPIKHITSYIDKLSSIIKTGLSQLPDRLAARIAKETDEETCYHLIMMEIHEISEQLENALSEEALHKHLASSETKAKMISGGKVASSHR